MILPYQLCRAKVGGIYHVTYPRLDTALCGKPLTHTAPRAPLYRAEDQDVCKGCGSALLGAIDVEIAQLSRVRDSIIRRRRRSPST